MQNSRVFIRNGLHICSIIASRLISVDCNSLSKDIVNILCSFSSTAVHYSRLLVRTLYTCPAAISEVCGEYIAPFRLSGPAGYHWMKALVIFIEESVVPHALDRPET
jgi:hypothetical protein